MRFMLTFEWMPDAAKQAEAIECFLRTQMDVLVVGSNMIWKQENADRGKTRAAEFAPAMAQGK